MKPNNRRILGRVLAWVTAAIIMVIIWVVFRGFVIFVLFSDAAPDNFDGLKQVAIQAKYFTRDALLWIVSMSLGIGLLSGYTVRILITSGRVEEVEK